jgi:Copper type II ascorbate-dependent monooxygenase, C-terminal domain/Copper type II ascorbate-dependent monooxygenase, N-terminal domain
MKIVYMYHDDEPKRGPSEDGRLPEPEVALKPIKSLLLLQRPKFERTTKKHDETIESFDVRMKNVSMSNVTKACSIVRPKLNKPAHITAFKPVFEPLKARNYIIHMTVYECKHHADHTDDDESDSCFKQHALNCMGIIATWSRGSKGFIYPDDVGYPVGIGGTYFLVVHYEPFKSHIVDDSGVKFFTTAAKRKHDAGILSIGIQPVWTHIIPPGNRKITSIGYCTGKCNKEAFAPDGINVVGVQMQTHEMGKSMKIGLVRNGTELHPIAQDHNIDSEYLEFRQFEEAVRVMPGDDLIVECAYNSYEKTKLTLGGFEPQQEICQAMLIYYPRQEKLTSCQSKLKTRNFLKSLNIDKLRNVPPFAIELPEKYAGKTLEEHLKSYDWRTELDHFERVSKTSMVDILCSGAEKKVCFRMAEASLQLKLIGFFPSTDN